ncbi:PREDICTED: putative F-box protein PP2-B2 [Lupinus angustifolius]|uniref:putative F-box protein PP2-B2 n=1 Tax=Lupinus angustifolius TaxID=3871 RepID=UPI00092FC220|nr:PREDICTED: putative F-box protein PP2-B2 [Lupinus angustifolius]
MVEITKVLTEECMSIVVSFTSPKDECRLPIVYPSFKNVSDSDAMWERVYVWRKLVAKSVAWSGMNLYWVQVKGILETKHLSPNTSYVYFIFKFPKDFDSGSFIEGHLELNVCKETIYDYHISVISQPLSEEVQEREDGWNEVEMGKFFNDHGEDYLIVFKI